MANVLVAFASHDGQTQKVAERIATVLLIRRHEVELVDLGRTASGPVDLSRFQAVLVGSPIRAQGYLRPVVRFVRTHRTQLDRLPTLFFSVGLAVLSKIGDGRAQTMRIVEKLVAETGWHPGRIELVAGALKYTRYNFLVRFVMRRISRKERGDTDTSRDHECTDWAAIDRFAVEFVDQLEGSRPAEGTPRAAPEARV
jgi:menaquinone-dependent protoporphyrinogen oxidase